MIGPIRYSPDKLLLGDGGVLLGQPDGLAAEVNSATFLAAMGIGTAATFSVDYFATAVHSHDDRYYTETEADALLSAKADLVGGKLPTSQLPALAVAEFLGVVANEAAMLALDGQRGDWCNRSDEGLDYRLIDDDATVLASWRPIDGPTSAVVTVNGQAGTVVLGAADVGAAPAIHTHNFADLASLPNTLAGFGITDAATAAQGALADSAVQPATLANYILASAIGVTVQPYDADTAKLDLAQVWSVSQIPDAHTITFSATIDDDWQANKEPVRVLTVTGDVTSFTASDAKNVASPSDATEYKYSKKLYAIKMDSTGDHTFTFSGIGGTEPVIDTTADAVTLFEIEFVFGVARFV